MDLKSFVAETLVQIVEGVADAQKRIHDLNVGAAVNPHAVPDTTVGKTGRPSPIQFDVAITVTDETASKTGAGASAGFLSVVSAKVDAKAEASDTIRNEAVSRVQFVVNVAQPADLEAYRTSYNVGY
jgi:hypothetical protein